MGQETQDLLIRLRSDSTGVEEGNRRAAKSFDDLKTVALGTAAGFGAVAGVIKGIVETAQRGQGFSELEGAFKRLGQTEGDLTKLRTSLQGLVSDTDIFRAANQALTAGLKPEQFEAAAAAADALGDSVGKDTKTALDDLTTALTKGNDKLLAQYGILIDNQKAYDDYGKKIGVAGKSLNELGKVEAMREAILKAVAEKTANLGDETASVADEFTRLSNVLTGSLDRFAAVINSSETLANVFRDFGRGIDILAEKFLGLGSAQAKMVELQNQVTRRQGNLTAMQSGFYPGAGGPAEDAERAAIAAAQHELDGLLTKYRETSRAAETHTESVEKLRAKYVDMGKAAKGAATESLKEFKQFGSELTDLWDNIPFIGEKSGETRNLTQAERDAIDQLQDDFQETADFFGDALTGVLHGVPIEDIVKGQLEGAAVDFGSKLAAQLVMSLGGSATGVAAGAGFGLLQFQGLKNSLSGKPSSLSSLQGIGERGAAAFATFGASELLNLGGGLFGGDSQKGAEREAREKLIQQIFGGDLKFGGGSIDPSKFNASGKFGGQGTALVNPLAHSLTGGDDKLGSDLAGIFENAVTEGDSFNETIVKTLSLMDKLGTNADETKDAVSQLFLDGKISLEEFSADIDNLNVLAQEDLTGPNSVADAIQIVTENLDNPRVALKGLELAFKEMAELGIDSSEEIHAYITEKFGPQVAAAFDHITAAGLDTWGEIGSAGPDQLRLIFDALKPLQTQFDTTADSAKALGDANMDRLVTGLDKVKKKADDARAAVEKLNKAVEGGVTTGNTELNRRAP